jgi:hypothetical protein
MVAFFDWFIRRDTLALLRLLEAAEYFDPQAFNPVFQQQLDALLDRITDDEARRQILELQHFDFGNYVSRSLRRAGYRNAEEENAFQQIIIKLLISPGKVLAGWQPGKHGPLEKRLRASIWNSIRNIQEKTRNRRRWMTAVDPTVMAGQYAGRAPYSDVVDQFRSLVAQRLGKVALEILDARLAGEDIKNLVGKSTIGTPSAYYIKREVLAIKELARQFASQLGDPTFSGMVFRAMDSERMTVAKRQAARQAQ